jgi:hypothetical protein
MLSWGWVQSLIAGTVRVQHPVVCGLAAPGHVAIGHVNAVDLILVTAGGHVLSTWRADRWVHLGCWGCWGTSGCGSGRGPSLWAGWLASEDGKRIRESLLGSCSC